MTKRHLELEENIRTLEEEASAQNKLVFEAQKNQKKKEHEAVYRETMAKLQDQQSKLNNLKLKRDLTAENLEKPYYAPKLYGICY